MTLNDIELATYRRCGYADTPATEVVTRMLQWINIWHQRLLARPGVELLREVSTVLPSVVGQTVYNPVPAIRRIKNITDPTTPLTLRMVDIPWIREQDPGAVVMGIPEVWAPYGWNVITPPVAQLTIQLWPTPSAVITYVVEGQGLVVDLVAATDVPRLPYEYHWLLVEAACYEEWMRKADTRSGSARQDLETGFKEMRNWVYNNRDYRPSNLADTPSRSRLGGMYPAW